MNKMPDVFRSDRQQRLFDAVLKGILSLGYQANLCPRGYEFADWFDRDCGMVRIPAAAFARQPTDYNSACLGVFLQNGGSTPLRYRSLGAPFGIEVREDSILPWSIGSTAETTHATTSPVPADGLDRFFASVQCKWAPSPVLRAKNLGKAVVPKEIDWVDLGLLPALEHEISTKLERVLLAALDAGQSAYRREKAQKADPEELYRLVFRLLAGKVFHDRKVCDAQAGDFRQMDATAEPREVLRAVSSYYNEPQNYLAGRETQLAVASELWTGLSFQNLSVDALAFIYENTLVDDKLRKESGIHSTPHRVAKYIVDNLPFEDIPEAERVVVEPCSGHGVFLVSALKRLRDLLDPSWTNKKRHKYFVEHLFGFELDSFAREVSKLCLTLADFPNPNGWNLEKADVFRSTKFTEALGEARIVLCNPPFEDFSSAERLHYGTDIGTSKPTAVLQRVLQHARKDAQLGFVLPRTMVDGVGYKEIRRTLAKRYGRIDLVALPDRVFRHADVETVLLLAHSSQGQNRCVVHFSDVKKAQLRDFYTHGAVTRCDSGIFTADEAEQDGLHVPVLREIWERLAHLPKLRDIVEMHRGVEWKAPFDECKFISTKPRAGWPRGLRNVQEGFESYTLPKPVWLNPDPQYQLYDAWALPWHLPKVIVNAARKARGSWRIAAAPDASGLVCTQNFHCLWPKHGWTINALAALINSPVTSAYIASLEGKRHVRRGTLQECPVPKLTDADRLTLDGLVETFMTLNADKPESRLELWGGGSQQERARQILLEMDAIILKAYNLPPWMERKLLDFFKGEKRPVPFAFGDYYAEGFTPNLPLHMLISPTFRSSTAGRILPHLPNIQDEALTAALDEVA